MKVTVVGAGALGATCADNIARKELCEELVNIEHRLELLVCRLLNHVIPAVSGVIHDDVDRVEFGKRSVHNQFGNLGICEIPCDVTYSARMRQFRFGFQKHLLIKIVDHYPRPRIG